MQTNEMIKSTIEQGLTTLGIEFGSTRIKAVLINTDHEPIAVGAYDWETVLSMAFGLIAKKKSGLVFKVATKI